MSLRLLRGPVSGNPHWFNHLLMRHGWLVGSFEMLAPMVKNKELSDRIFKSAKNAGARYVLRTLFDSCVLDAYMLFHAHEDTDPSISRLARPFPPNHRHKNPRLLTQLADLNYPKDKELRRKFRSVARTWIDELTADWGRLSKATKDFDTLRNRWIAHHKLEWDPCTQIFQLPKIATSMNSF
jgi:hypothetical protein